MFTINENELKLLQMIRRNPGCTKSKLATMVEMPWSSAYTAISKLNDKIIIRQDEECSSEGNFETNNYKAGIYINPNYEYYVGVSVGSSQLKVVLLGFDFSILSIYSVNEQVAQHINAFYKQMKDLDFKQHQNSLCQWCKDTPETIEQLSSVLISICENICRLKENGVNIVAINFALPGHIDFYNQKIISTSHLCNESNSIKNSSISRLISSSMYDRLCSKNIFVYVDHNVKSSAIAEKEYRFSHTSNKEDLIVVYLGRGVGSSMIINGSLFRDVENISGQFGEITVLSNCSLRKLGDVIREDIFPKTQCNPTIEELKEQLKNESKKLQLVDILSQSLSNLIHVVGIKDIIFSGKFDGMLDIIELDLNNKLESTGIYGIRLHHSVYDQYSASVGAAIGCFYNLYGIDYSWN